MSASTLKCAAILPQRTSIFTLTRRAFAFVRDGRNGEIDLAQAGGGARLEHAVTLPRCS
jgi:hypothetical protein